MFYLEFLNYERLDDFRHDYGDEWNGCNAGDAKKLEVDTLDLGEYICDEVKKGVIDGAEYSAGLEPLYPLERATLSAW